MRGASAENTQTDSSPERVAQRTQSYSMGYESAENTQSDSSMAKAAQRESVRAASAQNTKSDSSVKKSVQSDSVRSDGAPAPLLKRFALAEKNGQRTDPTRSVEKSGLSGSRNLEKSSLSAVPHDSQQAASPALAGESSRFSAAETKEEATRRLARLSRMTACGSMDYFSHG